LSVRTSETFTLRSTCSFCFGSRQVTSYSVYLPPSSQTTNEVTPGFLPLTTTVRSEPTAASATSASAIETVLTSFGVSRTSDCPAFTVIGNAEPEAASAGPLAKARVRRRSAAAPKRQPRPLVI